MEDRYIRGDEGESAGRVSPCPLCGEDRAVRQPKFEGYLGYPSTHQIVRCAVCGMIYVSPRPPVHEVEAVYSSDTYSVETYLGRSLVLERIPDFERIYAKLEQYLPRKGLLLEVGCAMGHFLRVGQSRGWHARGIDASPHLVTYARSHFGLDVQVATSLREADVAPQSVDVIYAEHVLEHLRDPMDMLVEMKEALREGGYLVVMVPYELGDIRYALRRLLFRKHAARVSTGSKARIGHINFFTPKTLVTMVQQAGLVPLSYSTWGVAARRPMVTRSPPLKRWLKSKLFTAASWFDKGPNIEVFAARGRAGTRLPAQRGWHGQRAETLDKGRTAALEQCQEATAAGRTKEVRGSLVV